MGPPEILAAFRALPLHRRHEAMRMACTYALDVWERYARSGDPVEYVDSVVGMRHRVDMQLPGRAVAAVDRKLAGERVDPKAIWDAYTEPIVALQDGDLDFPDDIALAYYAIYNLFGFVFGLTRLHDDGEIVIKQASTSDGYVEEWWTRTWDAWATRAPPKYAPTELDDPTFAAIAAGDLAGAIARVPDTRLGVALLAIAGRTDEAIATASRVIGVDDDAWLRRYAQHLGPSDAIAVSRDGKLYAAICGRRYHVREIADNRKRLDGRCSWDLRRVGFTTSSEIVCFAGDASDDIGPFETIVSGEELYTSDPPYRAEWPGARTIVALGSGAEIVCASDREAGIVTGAGFERFGDARVTGAVLAPSHLVTYAGAELAVWSRETRARVLAMELGSEIWHAVIAERRLLVACRGERAHVIDLGLL